MSGCPHRPPCQTASTWICEKRSEVELAIARGVVTAAEGASLMAKYGVRLTPPSRVDSGTRESGQKRLL